MKFDALVFALGRTKFPGYANYHHIATRTVQQIYAAAEMQCTPDGDRAPLWLRCKVDEG